MPVEPNPFSKVLLIAEFHKTAEYYIFAICGKKKSKNPLTVFVICATLVDDTALKEHIMARNITITVSEDLWAAIQRWRDRIAVSKVCQDALANEVAKFESLPQEVRRQLTPVRQLKPTRQLKAKR